MGALLGMAMFVGIFLLIGLANKGVTLPGGIVLPQKQWLLLAAEYQRLELHYNLAAQAVGNPPYWMDPAQRFGPADPMAQLAALNVDANEKTRRALAAGRGDLALGFFAGYTTGPA